MKIEILLFFIILVTSDCAIETFCSYNFDTTTYQQTEVTSTKAEDCSNRLHATEKNPTSTTIKPKVKCCYMYYSKEKEGSCQPLTQAQLDNIKKYVKRVENQDTSFDEEGDLRIDCSSFLMKLGFLSLLTILL